MCIVKYTSDLLKMYSYMNNVSLVQCPNKGGEQQLKQSWYEIGIF